MSHPTAYYGGYPQGGGYPVGHPGGQQQPQDVQQQQQQQQQHAQASGYAAMYGYGAPGTGQPYGAPAGYGQGYHQGQYATDPYAGYDYSAPDGSYAAAAAGASSGYGGQQGYMDGSWGQPGGQPGYPQYGDPSQYYAQQGYYDYQQSRAYMPYPAAGGQASQYPTGKGPWGGGAGGGGGGGRFPGASRGGDRGGGRGSRGRNRQAGGAGRSHTTPPPAKDDKDDSDGDDHYLTDDDDESKVKPIDLENHPDYDPKEAEEGKVDIELGKMTSKLLEQMVGVILTQEEEDDNPYTADNPRECYMFGVSSINDGALRPYDGTLSEIYPKLYADVHKLIDEFSLGGQVVTVINGADPDFEMLLSA